MRTGAVLVHHAAVNRVLAYRILSGAFGALLVLFGLVLFVGFFRYQVPHSVPAIPTGPVGHYFVAFTGCALVAWGGGLLGVARDPKTGRALATATALALVMSAVYRMAGWVVGDYYVWLGDLPRGEAALFLALALGFVWLRPRARATPEA